MIFLFLTLIFASSSLASDVYVFGFRGKTDDAVGRFERSLQVFGYTYKLVNVSTTGLRDLREMISEAAEARYILFLDSHTSLLLDGPKNVAKQADKIDADFLFPERGNVLDKDILASNDAIFKGMLAKTEKLVPILSDLKDDLKFEEEFLTALRQAHEKKAVKIAMDTDCTLFQVVNKDSGAFLKTRYDGDRGYVQNVHKDSVPLILCTSPEGKHTMNLLSNYLVRAWSPEMGCQICEEGKLDLSAMKESEYPVVQLTLLITEATPFLEAYFDRLVNLTYPKSRIDLVTFCDIKPQKPILDRFLAKYAHEYRSSKELQLSELARPIDAFREALSTCLKNRDCDFLFYVDSTVHLWKRDILEHLVSSNRNAIAPLMMRPGKFWSTFWGAITDEGAYLRSEDYFDIVERRQVGIWNVPLVGGSILFSRWAVDLLQESLDDSGFVLYDISNTARSKNLFLYVDNRDQFGHLVNPENYTLNHVHNDLYQIFDNPDNWEELYINSEFFEVLNKSVKKEGFEQPCHDVFRIPLMTETFCKHLLEEMEKFDKWSGGGVEGEFASVKAIGWEEHWKAVIDRYVYPLQLKLWEGYMDMPEMKMNLVVRYKQGEKEFVSPLDDTTNYVIDIPLNRFSIDFTGGELIFPRYNCSVKTSRVGWALMYPGKFTHAHENEVTKSGVRYAFITYIKS